MIYGFVPLDFSPRVDINGIVDSALATVRVTVNELGLDPIVLPGDKGDFIVSVESSLIRRKKF